MSIMIATCLKNQWREYIQSFYHHRRHRLKYFESITFPDFCYGWVCITVCLVTMVLPIFFCACQNVTISTKIIIHFKIHDCMFNYPKFQGSAHFASSDFHILSQNILRISKTKVQSPEDQSNLCFSQYGPSPIPVKT